MKNFERITVDPAQMGGVPGVRHLRIPVATVLRLLAGGMTEHEIMSEYPDLETEDIRECLRFAAAIFRGVETTLAGLWDRSPHKEEILRKVASRKNVEGQTFEDSEHFRKLVHVIFFAGFKAEIVEHKRSVIDKHLRDYRKVSTYGDA